MVAPLANRTVTMSRLNECHTRELEPDFGCPFQMRMNGTEKCYRFVTSDSIHQSDDMGGLFGLGISSCRGLSNSKSLPFPAIRGWCYAPFLTNPATFNRANSGEPSSCALFHPNLLPLLSGRHPCAREPGACGRWWRVGCGQWTLQDFAVGQFPCWPNLQPVAPAPAVPLQKESPAVIL